MSRNLDCMRILPPPPLPSSVGGGASASASPPRLSCVLLDDRGFIANDRRNNTTAYATTRNGDQFHASFFLAEPPLVSYFCVSHPRAAGPSSKSAAEFRCDPFCIAAEADLVLLSVDHYIRQSQDYYVYQAGASGSTLTLLPRPGPGIFERVILNYIGHRRAGLLRYGDDRGGGGYVIAVLHETAYVGRLPAALCICIFDSKTNAWSRMPAAVDKQQPRWQEPNDLRLRISSVITIGGTTGIMGWVEPDGIIFGDVLAESPVQLRHVPFPPSFLTDDWINHHRIGGCMSMSQDIAFVGGHIRYIQLEMYIREIPDPYAGQHMVSDGWTAVMWSMADFSGDWHKDWELHAHEVSTVDEDGNTVPGFELLPTLRDDKGTLQPTLERMHIVHPTISLCDEDIVYLKAKVDHKDPGGWVIALDTRKKRLQGVAEYTRTGKDPFMEESYMLCTVSQYLNVNTCSDDQTRREEEAQPTKRTPKPSTKYPPNDWVTS